VIAHVIDIQGSGSVFNFVPPAYPFLPPGTIPGEPEEGGGESGYTVLSWELL